MQEIINALCDTFTEDPSSPSVVLSRLDNGKYYGSLVRYSEAFGKGKQVLFKCSEDTLEAVLAQLRTQLGLPNAERDGTVRSDGAGDPPSEPTADE